MRRLGQRGIQHVPCRSLLKYVLFPLTAFSCIVQYSTGLNMVRWMLQNELVELTQLSACEHVD